MPLSMLERGAKVQFVHLSQGMRDVSVVSLCCDEGRRSHDQDSVLVTRKELQLHQLNGNRRCTKHRTLLSCTVG